MTTLREIIKINNKTNDPAIRLLDSITRIEEMVKKNITEITERIFEKKKQEIMKELNKEVFKMLNDVKKQILKAENNADMELKGIVSDFQSKYSETINKVIQEHIDEDAIAEKAFKKIPTPENGKDADPKDVVSLVLKELPKEITPEELVKKINTLNEKMEISVIKGLGKILGILKVNLKNVKGGGGGMGNWIHETFTGDGSTTTFTLSYGVAAAGKAAIVRYQGQVQDDTTHYSISGKSLSITFMPADGTKISIAYVRA